MANPSPPLPIPQPESEFYWRKLRDREIWLRFCEDCARHHFYPRPICPFCFSRNVGWRQSSGRGVLYTFSIVHRPPAPHFADRVPYVAALVELEDRVRMPTNLVEVDPDPAKIRIGSPVTPIFEDVSAEITLLKFRPE